MNIMFVSPTTTMKNGASRCYAEFANYLVNKYCVSMCSFYGYSINKAMDIIVKKCITSIV